jgi:hypothetical protein
MNKGRLVGGLICLASAVLLAVLAVALPDGEVMFMVGDTNRPIIPVIVLAGLGVMLLTTALGRRSMRS